MVNENAEIFIFSPQHEHSQVINHMIVEFPPQYGEIFHNFVRSAADGNEGQEGQGPEAVEESLLSFSDPCSGIRLAQNSQKDPMDKKTNLQYLDLEFSKLEKAEMITYLNRLLTSYQIYVHQTIEGLNKFQNPAKQTL